MRTRPCLKHGVMKSPPSLSIPISRSLNGVLDGVVRVFSYTCQVRNKVSWIGLLCATASGIVLLREKMTKVCLAKLVFSRERKTRL